MTEHTLVPWSLENRPYIVAIATQDERRGTTISAGLHNPDAGSYWPAIGNAGITLVEARANAEFIVRACNAHDALVEACKRAAADFARFRPHDNGTIQQLRAAIAKAKP